MRIWNNDGNMDKKIKKWKLICNIIFLLLASLVFLAYFPFDVLAPADDMVVDFIPQLVC